MVSIWAIVCTKSSVCTFVMRIVEISYNEYRCILHEKVFMEKIESRYYIL